MKTIKNQICFDIKTLIFGNVMEDVFNHQLEQIKGIHTNSFIDKNVGIPVRKINQSIKLQIKKSRG